MSYKEGDIWQERGKTWTIKNGVKRTVSRFSETRRELIEPLSCPECGKKMSHRNDSIMWKHHKKCFDCVIEFETELIRTGQFEEYQREKVAKNVESFLKDLQLLPEELLKTTSNDRYVTEDGDIENWIGGMDSEKVAELLKPQIEKIKKQLTDARTNTD